MSDTSGHSPAAAGGLDQISLAGFLFALFKRDATGELSLTHGEGLVDTVYLREGFPVFVRNNRVTVDVLGAILTELGVINHAALNRSLELFAQGGAKHGEILVHMGVVSPEVLRHALGVQLRRKINRLFYIQEGRIEWFFREHDRAAEVHAHPFQVILQGVRSAFGPERLQGLQERLKGKAVKLPGGFAPYAPLYEFDDDEKVAVGLLQNGWYLPEDVAVGAGMSEQRTRTLLHALDLTEVLDARDAATVPVSAVVPPPASVQVPIRPRPPSQPPAAQRPSVPTPPARTPSGPYPVVGARPPSGSTPVVAGRPLTPPSGSHGLPPPSGSHGLPPPSGSHPLPSPSGSHRTPLEAIRDRLVAKHASLATASHFAVLEIDHSANAVQVNEAFRALAKLYHPDRMPRDVLESMRATVDEVFQRLTEAHKILGDDKEREAYRTALQAGGHRDKVDASGLLQAEQAFHKGEVALKRGAYAQAEKEFAEALRLNSAEPEYEAAVAWARYKSGALGQFAPKLRKDALTIVQRVIKDRGDSEKLEYWLADLLEADGQINAAMAHYRKVVAMNRHHVDAKRKIHLHEQKRGWHGPEDSSDKKKAGLFSGLFGKKK